MVKAAKHLQEIPYSTIRLMYETAPPGSINLALGDSYVPQLDSIIEAGITAHKDGFVHYTHNLGFPELRRTLSKWYENKLLFDVDETKIIVTSGGIQAIFESLLAHINPHDEVLYPIPGFEPYPTLIRLVHGKPVPYVLNRKTDYQLRVEDISKLLTKKTKAIIINSPNNPTGAIYSAESLEELAGLVDSKQNLFVISDEVYDRIIYPPNEHRSIGEFTDNSVIISSISKPYGQTGARLGWAVADEGTIGNLLLVHQNIQACAPSISQMVAETALKEAVDSGYYLELRDATMKELNKKIIPFFTPQGANYVYIDALNWGDDSVAIAQDITTKARVILTPGKAFGDPEPNLRMCFTSVDEVKIEDQVKVMEEAVRRIATVLK